MRGEPSRTPLLKFGARTLLTVPNVGSKTELVGAIGIYRQEVRPFTDKQIELVKISPLRPSLPWRTRGCSTNCASVPTISPTRWTEQTAMSEVLEPSSASSPCDLEPVFQAIVEKRVHGCARPTMASTLSDRGRTRAPCRRRHREGRGAGQVGDARPLAPAIR